MSASLVRDIMVTEVVTLRPGDSVADAVDILLENDLGGVPVVDDDDRIVGLLSDSDLVVRQGRIHLPTIYTLFREGGGAFPPASLEAFATALRKALGSTVSELMDPQPACCREDETVEEVATRMLERGASRLPVVREGRLVGIIARADLVRLLASTLDDDDVGKR